MSSMDYGISIAQSPILGKKYICTTLPRLGRLHRQTSVSSNFKVVMLAETWRSMEHSSCLCAHQLKIVASFQCCTV